LPPREKDSGEAVRMKRLNEHNSMLETLIGPFRKPETHVTIQVTKRADYSFPFYNIQLDTARVFPSLK
jgi:hypothetical protein